uniref:Acyl-CoA desaturase 2 n=1 Tax=Lygus hesperus TaxID=30085 RepID=A0A0A9Y5R8_LYGHE
MFPGAALEMNKMARTTSLDTQNDGCKSPNSEKKQDIIWVNTVVFIFANMVGIYILPHFLFTIDWSTFLFTWFLVVFSSMGITAGAHRLWSHKSYKANAPLRLLLMIMNSTMFSNSIYAFVRDHRVHHKFVDTDADPHNSKRGFFYSHMGWLMVKRLPVTKERVKQIDMSDIERDKIVMFQRDYQALLMPLFTLVIPTLIPVYFWGCDPWEAFLVCGIARWAITLHGVWAVNSFAHLYGYQSYDTSLSARQNVYVSFWAFGEGWHNYHHAFPWDYKTSEYPYHVNLTTAFIDCFAKIGWAYDLKTVKPDVIARRVARTGGRSQHLNGVSKTENFVELSHNNIWGWDDTELTESQKEIALVVSPSN